MKFIYPRYFRCAKVFHLVVIGFFLAFFILQTYYFFFFAKYAFANPKLIRPTQQPISVVICGKNAAEQFAENIPKICTQNYQNFEVVIVDDHSTDNTVEVVKSLQHQFKNIKLIKKEAVPDRAGKKAALYTGVKATKNQIVIVTDADCYPVSQDWLSLIAAEFKEGIELVLAISPNEKERGFWKGLFRFETVQTAMLYVSFALRGVPYMGVGRNMAFRRAHFLEHFVQILEDDIASGDDDLLVNISANAKSTAVCLHPDSYTLSPSPENFAKWFRQKQRHLSAGFCYKTSHIILLSLFPLAQVVLLVTGFWLLAFSNVWALVLIVFLFQFMVQQIIHTFILKKINQVDIALEYPFYQFLWLFLQPLLGILSYFKPKSRWN